GVPWETSPSEYVGTRPSQDGEVFFLSIPFHPLCYSNVTRFIRRIAKELHHSRKTVRKALQDPGPWEYRMSRPRPAPKVGPYRELVRQWRLEDGNAPRKQRHTARR